MLQRPERDELYRGALKVRKGGLDFVEDLASLLKRHFGENPRQPQPDHLQRLTAAREELASSCWRDRTRGWLSRLGINGLGRQDLGREGSGSEPSGMGEPSGTGERADGEGSGVDGESFALDRIRLRGVTPGSHKVKAAEAAFYAHRDTWYANPQAQINLWLPLHDVDGSNSFTFYPDFFEKPVANDSENFDYNAFLQQGGFQKPNSPTVHPRWLEQPSPPGGQPVVLSVGTFLLFAASHLHATLPNLGDQVRFSIDLRLVHRADHKMGRGAPNVDNRSQGSAIQDYVW